MPYLFRWSRFGQELTSARGVWRIMSQRLALAAVDHCLSVSDSPDDLKLAQRVICDPSLDWVAVVWWANKYFVAPALWTSLSRPSLREFIPLDVQNYLAFLHGLNAARNQRIRLQCLDIGSTLACAGIRAALLKGAAWLFDGNSSDAHSAASNGLICSDKIARLGLGKHERPVLERGRQTIRLC